MSDPSKPPSTTTKPRPPKPAAPRPTTSLKDEKPPQQQPASASTSAPSSSSSLLPPSSSASPSLEEYPSTSIGSYMSRQYDYEVESKKMPGFICGACYSVKTFQVGEDLRCRKCGYRIMYKERLRRPMVYSAQ